MNKLYKPVEILYPFRDRILDLRQPQLMKILNVTPDSFSDGGKYYEHSKAIECALEAIDDGVKILDIGGESSRPGADPVSIDEELKRVIPVIEGIRKYSAAVFLSLDTVKSQVAEAGLQSGADIINDISGGLSDPRILEVTSRYDAGYIIMHMQGIPKTMQVQPHYNDPVSEIYSFLEERINAARSAGIIRIIIDPGIGFGKLPMQNIELIRHIGKFTALRYPVLIGLSMKSFMSKLLNVDLENRKLPTAVLEFASLLLGASMIRTHDHKNAQIVIQLLSLLRSVHD